MGTEKSVPLYIIYMGLLSQIGNALLGSAGSLATGLLGGAASVISQNSANKANAANIAATNAANLQISRETNRANRQIAADNNAANLALAREQNEWNIAQWNRENEYNSPEQQVQRLEQAGMNGLGNIDSNTASSVSSADLANQTTGAPMQGATMQAAQVNPLDFSQIMQGLANAVQIGKTQADTKAVNQNVRWNEIFNGQIMSFNEIRNQVEAENLDYFRKRYKPYATSAGQMDNMRQEFDTKAAKAAMEINQHNAQIQAFQVKNQQEMYDRTLKQIDQALAKGDIEKQIMQLNLDWLPREKQTELRAQLASIAKTQADTTATIDANKRANELQPYAVASAGADYENKTVQTGQMKAALKKAVIDNLSNGNQSVRTYLSNPANYDAYMRASSKVAQGKEGTMTKQEKEVWDNTCEYQHTHATAFVGDVMRNINPLTGLLQSVR